MKVTLLSHTADALDLLLFTKQTRLAQTPGLLAEIKAWPLARKLKELDYMLGTIHSSWEFVNYTFHIDGVTRAFTHQLVRTRHGSYAQQSQRTVDMSGFDYMATGTLDDPSRLGPYNSGNGLEEAYCYPPGSAKHSYHKAMAELDEAYQHLLESGTPPQDARGVLPTNVVTNIVAAFNLRTLSDMAKLRLCTRTQGEYQDVFRAMRAAVIEVHPWAEPFIRVHCAALGVCAFPNYTECPIKGPVFNPDTGRRWDDATVSADCDHGCYTYKDAPPATRDQIQRSWEATRYEARPRQLPVVSHDAL